MSSSIMESVFTAPPVREVILITLDRKSRFNLFSVNKFFNSLSKKVDSIKAFCSEYGINDSGNWTATFDMLKKLHTFKEVTIEKIDKSLATHNQKTDLSTYLKSLKQFPTPFNKGPYFKVYESESSFYYSGRMENHLIELQKFTTEERNVKTITCIGTFKNYQGIDANARCMCIMNDIGYAIYYKNNSFSEFTFAVLNLKNHTVMNTALIEIKDIQIGGICTDGISLFISDYDSTNYYKVGFR